MMVSWSVLGHILSGEQSLDGSDRVSDDGHLTIVQCHPYHQPPSSDLYRTSVGIHPLLQYHQQVIILIIAITNQHHALHCWHWMVFPWEKPISRQVLCFPKGFSHENTKSISERKIKETCNVFLRCFL